jgi:hypothetical protein
MQNFVGMDGMSKLLVGVDLIDCARANAEHGLQVAAQQCGYGEDLDGFHQALTEAGQHMGIDIESLGHLEK